MKRLIYLLTILLSTMMSCKDTKKPMLSEVNITDCTHKSWVSLTVAESKRLIALGLTQYAPVKERMANGTIIIAKGTTNSYVAQELLGENLPNGSFVSGHILPSSGDVKLDRSVVRREIVLVDGEDVDAKYTVAIQSMKAGDIVMKGANIINYAKGKLGS